MINILGNHISTILNRQNGLPNPIDVAGNKLEFWFDNSDTSTLTLVNGNEIINQVDKTGNFNRNTNTDSNGNRPVYDTVRKEIYFDGISHALVLQETLSVAAQAGGEIFIVMRRDNDFTGNPCLFGAYDTVNSNRWALLQDAANSSDSGYSIRITWSLGATVNTVYGNVKILSDKVQILNFRINPEVSYTLDWDNRGGIGEVVGAGSNIGRWIDNLTTHDKVSFGLFQSAGSTFFSSYHELEFVYFNQILNVDERDKIYNYLNNKHNAYSITTNHIGVILAGQSNAVGMGVDATRPARLTGMSFLTGIKIWTATNTFSQYTTANDGGLDFGIDTSLLPALSEYYKNGQVYFLKVAETGAPLASEAGRNDWNISNSELYPTLETRALELQSALNLLGNNKLIFIWIQGERDVREVSGGEPDAYEANLNGLLDELSSAGVDVDYYIINKLHDDFILETATPDVTLENLKTVQTAQESIVEARQNAYLLDMNNFNMNPADYTHYLGPEYIKIGEYVFSQILKSNKLIP